ncbi:hypothetical protein IQ235_16575 [Oscillatoriales cyanobacterium LEGE 11467]|uniref:Uncharacterized protein n=1 Tax=Zarconia navalis LEGE 11467 TaxID=1828826 RepID=A0A928VZB2_9CYAN|nr:hypothetical protein [Zarconia navalis]MBE9042389.1 hypothetical protein [Zarconia navalis LEGE 11467]
MKEDRKISELTPQQEAQLDAYKRKWQQVALSTTPIDKQNVKQAIEAIYEKTVSHELEIYFFDSPEKVANLSFLTRVYPQENWSNPKKLNNLIRQVEKDLSKKILLPRTLFENIQNPLLEAITRQLDIELWHHLERRLSFQSPISTVIHQELRGKEKLSPIWKLAKPAQKKRLEGLWRFLSLANLQKPGYLCSRCCIFDYCINELKCSVPEKPWQILTTFVAECGWTFFFYDFCFTCDRPCKLILDEQNKPHSENEAAIQFSDGFHAFAQ